jgi:hypothetical protein
MYQTKLTKEQLAYNIAYHLEKETDKPIHEVILETLTAYEENLKKVSKTLDKE